MNSIQYFDKDPGYETIKRITSGYFTSMPLLDGRILFLNENGMNDCEINEEASKMCGMVVYGNIAIVGTKMAD
jgi:hypothetical protein